MSGSASGITSILVSWQVCHNGWLGIIAFLGIIGITIVRMPLLFLTKLAIPFWTVALLLLLITIGLYFRKRGISKNLIIFNSGLIIAGVPFPSLQKFSAGFWVVGGTIVATATFIFIKNKLQRRTKNEKRL